MKTVPKFPQARQAEINKSEEHVELFQNITIN